MEYFVNSNFTFRAGIDNLLNRAYQNHLRGIAESPVLARLPIEGLSAWAEITHSF
ncbi:MAG: hypothetical protein MJK12_06210 [Colwellia sp.]|nr:hypothetical protein [Colwellia sp.]